MSYGLEIYDALGATTLSLTDTSYSVIDIITVASGATGSMAYSWLIGWELTVAQIQDQSTGADYTDVNNFTAVDVDITYPSGIPTLDWVSTAVIGTGQTVRLIVLAN